MTLGETFAHLALETLALDMVDGGTAVLTIDRPERMNAQTVRMFAEHRIVARVLRDMELRALVITGAGDDAFCAGFDLDEIDVVTGMGPVELSRFAAVAAGGLGELHALPFPVIAAVNGAAAGGGLALALAADIRLASSTAVFTAAFVSVGLSVGDLGTSWQLSRLVGPGRAAELAFTGRSVDAEEAARIGLVNHVVPPGELRGAALALAKEVSGNSPGGILMSKRSLQLNAEVASFAAARELENRGQALLAGGADMPEALSAFKEHRRPRFTGT